MKKLLSLLNDESGATAIEYSLIASLIVIGLVASFEAIGAQVASPLNSANQAMSR